MLAVVILCLPSFLPSSATFAFSEDFFFAWLLFPDSFLRLENRSVWAMYVTSTRFSFLTHRV